MSIRPTTISKVTGLFSTPDRADFSIRDEVPLRQDPLLDGLIAREKPIVEAVKNPSQDLSVRLQSQGFTRVTTVFTKKNRAIHIWSDTPDKPRMVMDQGTWKITNLILQPLKTQPNPHFWGNYTDNVKTCTSVLTNEDPTFCGDSEGSLIYFQPSDQKAVVAAAPLGVMLVTVIKSKLD